MRSFGIPPTKATQMNGPENNKMEHLRIILKAASKSVDTDATHEAIESGIVALDGLEDRDDLHTALTFAVELDRELKNNKIGASNYVRFLARIVRLSNLTSDNTRLNRYLTLYSDHKNEYPQNTDQKFNDDYYRMFFPIDRTVAIEPQNTPLNQKGKRPLRPLLVEEYQKNHPVPYCGQITVGNHYQIIDQWISEAHLIDDESELILFRNNLYHAIFLGLLEDHSTQLQSFAYLSDKLAENVRWSGGMRVVTSEAAEFVHRLGAGFPADLRANYVAPGSVVALPVRYMSLASDLQQVTDQASVLGLIANVFTSPALRLSSPVLHENFLVELEAAKRLGLAGRGHNIDNVLPVGLSDSTNMLTDLATIVELMMSGDFKASQRLIDLKMEMFDAEGNEHEVYAFLEFCTSVVQSIRSFDTKATTTAAEFLSSLTVNRFPLSILRLTLLPCLKALCVVEALNDEEHSSEVELKDSNIYDDALKELRLIHQVYGSRNFIFVTLSLGILRWEMANRPVSANTRISSLFNLLSLIRFTHQPLTRTLRVFQLDFLDKTANDDEILKSVSIIQLDARRNNYDYLFLVAAKAKLNSLANIESTGREYERFVDKSLMLNVALSKNNYGLTDRDEFEFRFALMRNLILRKRFEDASKLSRQLVANPLTDSDACLRRRALSYQAFIANQNHAPHLEAEVWHSLHLQRINAHTPFYELQSTRRVAHPADPKVSG